MSVCAPGATALVEATGTKVLEGPVSGLVELTNPVKLEELAPLEDGDELDGTPALAEDSWMTEDTSDEWEPDEEMEPEAKPEA